MVERDDLIERLESAPQWWRLRDGLSGLKPVMPGTAIRWARERGYRWPRHYVPICDGCPALKAREASHD